MVETYVVPLLKILVLLNAVLGFTQLLRHDARERLTSQELSQLDLV